MSNLVKRQDLIKMDRTAVSVRGVLDELRMQISILETDIKACDKSKLEFERQIGMLQNRKDDLERQVKSNREWASSYDIEVGPFADKYNEMTQSIGAIYDHAKLGHKKGILLLEKEFGYHPAFKRPTDTFSATPFIPK